MYALFCLFLFVGVWLVFITRLIINARREKDIKLNNQEYYNYKLKQLYGKVQETKEGKKVEEAFQEKSLKRAGQSRT